MTDAKRDKNGEPVGLGYNGTTTKPLLVDPSTNEVLLDVTVESPLITARTTARRDENNIPTVYGVSSVDGTTPVPIRTNDSGAILLDVT